jgi:signal transduction histidine kinase
VLCIGLMIGGLILDIYTPQQFFAAIVWFVPIALSGLAFSKRFTFSLVVASVILGFLVSALNANAEGGLNTIALLNRILLAGTSVLVGVMTIHLSTFSQQLGQAQERESKVRQERDIERIAGKIASAKTLQDAFEQILPMLGKMLGAKGVLMANLQNNQLQEPYAALNMKDSAYQLGQVLSQQEPVLQKHNNQKIWILRLEQPALVLILLEPDPNCEEHLYRLEPVLTRTLERVRLLENLSQQQILLERRNSIIRDLVYAFSHDLRTPLMANAMNIKLALDGAFGILPEKYLRSLENGLTANQDLLELADELLLVARFESGESNPQSETIDLDQALEAMILRVETLARAREIQFKTQLQAMQIQGNSLDIRRLLQNLLDNAIKHSPRQGIIHLHLQSQIHQNQVYARLEITDSGQGIPPEVETRLFTRFSSPRAGGGSGLGLYLAKHIVESHHGKIGYTRTEKTIFWVELPAKTE